MTELSEYDVVTYYLYPTEEHDLSSTDTLATVYSTIAQFTKRWVWHRQTMTFKVSSSAGKEGIPNWHLEGSVQCGSNVLDEWFVVALLKAITVSHSSLVAQVQDSDGELLLIEAADALPAWAQEPQVAEGRVFIHQGLIHIIPVAENPASISPIPGVTPNPGVCAKVVGKYPTLSVSCDAVQAALSARLGPLPQDTSENHHSVNTLLPRPLIQLLARRPTLLTSLVWAVKERDQRDIRKSRDMQRLGSYLGSYGSLVECRLTLSKGLYAILSQTKLKPYKTSAWTQSTDSKAAVLGFLLSLGLEILLAREEEGNKQEKGEGNGELTAFTAKLEEVGYFRGELKGSRKYNQLLEESKSFWKSSSSQDNDRIFPLMEDMKDLCVSDKFSIPQESFIIGPPGEDDSEDWLEMTPEKLDRLLELQFGVKQTEAFSSDPSKIPEEVSNFLSRVSDMTGAEHGQGINFQEDKLQDTLEKLLGNMAHMKDLEAESDLSEDDSEDDDPVMADYMLKMDAELGDTKGVKGREELPDLDNPLDVDTNVLESLLKSYSAQMDIGGHGPTSSLLQSLGINPGRPGG